MDDIYSPCRYMVAVLAGGRGADRAESLAGGERMAAALADAGHMAELFDLTDAEVDSLPLGRFDCCLLAHCNDAGQEAPVQQQLDRLEVTYTGSNAAAARMAASKSATKTRLRQAGVPTSPHALVRAHQPDRQLAMHGLRLGWPLVIKPDRRGAGNVAFAENLDELRTCLDQRLRNSDTAWVLEPWIDGRELTVAVLGRRALPALETLSPRGMADFDPGRPTASEHDRFETGLPAEQMLSVEQTALATAEALGAIGLVSVKLMLDRACRLWVRGLNTTPSLAPSSLAMRAAERAGMSAVALSDWMIRDCLRKEARR